MYCASLTQTPLRVVLFGPRGGLETYRPQYGKRKQGRPPREWAEHLFSTVFCLVRVRRQEFQEIANYRLAFQRLVGRLCVLHQARGG